MFAVCHDRKGMILVIHHFTYGPVTPALAYVMSCTGSLLGLLCTARASTFSGRSRARWLIFGAFAIGGTGVWVMHFIAMLGFTVGGATIRYDIPLTLLSAVISVLVVGIGLFVVDAGEIKPYALIIGGAITGLGVAAMHYTGMAAMHMNTTLRYDRHTVTASVLIAVAAAIAALWAAFRVRGNWATAGAALIMGVAVSSMHYTGMAAMSVHGGASAHSLSGAQPMQFLVPLIVGISLSTICLATAVGTAPTAREMQARTELLDRVARRREGPWNGGPGTDGRPVHGDVPRWRQPPDPRP